MAVTRNPALDDRADEARARLDTHVREMVQWHFDPATGCPFWLEYAAKLDFDPRREVETFDELKRVAHRSADDEAPGGIDVIDGVVVE